MRRSERPTDSRAKALVGTLLLVAACGGPAPTSAPDIGTPATSTAPSTATVPSTTPAATMRPEAVTYGQHYCAALEAWDTALDDAVAWSTDARLEPSKADTPDPEIATALEVMRMEIGEVKAFPPVTPVARALEQAAGRLERVVGLLGPVMAERGPVSDDLEQHVSRLFADLSSAAEFHRVAEGGYGRLECPPDQRERISDAAGMVSFAVPDGWLRLGPSAAERETQLATIEDDAFVARLRQQADLAGPSGLVAYDAADPGASGIGAVVWSFLDPGTTDLLGSAEAIQAELASGSLLSEVAVRYLDRPAGDGARVVARSTDGDLRDQLIVDLVRVDAGIVLIVSIVPESDAPSYRLAIERVLGSLDVGVP
jgi:hypothetical protein